MTDVFAALADPTRRWILDRLRSEGAQSIKDLTAPLEITRQAVTKHLEVLEGAGLVRRETRGRERICRLEADPLKVVDQWIDRYAEAWDERLERFREYVEGRSAEEEGSAAADGREAEQATRRGDDG